MSLIKRNDIHYVLGAFPLTSPMVESRKCDKIEAQIPWTSAYKTSKAEGEAGGEASYLYSGMWLVEVASAVKLMHELLQTLHSRDWMMVYGYLHVPTM